MTKSEFEFPRTNAIVKSIMPSPPANTELVIEPIIGNVTVIVSDAVPDKVVEKRVQISILPAVTHMNACDIVSADNVIDDVAVGVHVNRDGKSEGFPKLTYIPEIVPLLSST